MIRTTNSFLLPRKRLYTTFLAAVLCTGTATAEAAIKCWKNNEGIRECGNVVPPEFAQQGHEEKSAGGFTVDSTEPAKSLEELRAEHALEQKKAEDALRQQEQAARDRVLLDTFSSEDDMLLARDGQISHLESQVKLTESHIEKLNKSLEELIQEAADHERRGNEPPAKLVRDIDSLREQIRENETFIKTKAQERIDMLDKFEADIARFRMLKGHSEQSTN